MLPFLPISIEDHHLLDPQAVVSAREIHVWLADVFTDSDPAVAKHWLSRLSDDERDRFERFAFDADKQRYLASRALVRAALSRYADLTPEAWRFSPGPLGRPLIVGEPGLRYSCSRTRGLVACLVAMTVDAGVDVEKLESRYPGLDIARRFFAPSEVSWLRSVPPEQAPSLFLLLWTVKEAFVKALGRGLSLPLDRFACHAGTDDGSLRLTFTDPGLGDPDEWSVLAGTVGEDHVLAAVTSGRGRGVRVRFARFPQSLLVG